MLGHMTPKCDHDIVCKSHILYDLVNTHVSYRCKELVIVSLNNWEAQHG